MNIDRTLARMEAVLKLTEDRLAEIAAVRDEMKDLAYHLMGAANDIDDIRGVAEDLREVARELKRADWMTSPAMAEELGVHINTLYKFYTKFGLPGHRITPTSHIYFDRHEVTEFLRQRDIKGEIKEAVSGSADGRRAG